MIMSNKIALAGVMITVLILLVSFVTGISNMQSDIENCKEGLELVKGDHEALIKMGKDVEYIKAGIDDIKESLKEVKE